MKTMSISAAKNGLSALLREVRRGRSVTITDRGVPVATVSPPASIDGFPSELVELARRGLVTLPKKRPSIDWLKLPLPRTTDGSSVVATLLEERESGW